MTLTCILKLAMVKKKRKLKQGKINMNTGKKDQSTVKLQRKQRLILTF